MTKPFLPCRLACPPCDTKRQNSMIFLPLTPFFFVTSYHSRKCSHVPVIFLRMSQFPNFPRHPTCPAPDVKFGTLSPPWPEFLQFLRNSLLQPAVPRRLTLTWPAIARNGESGASKKPRPQDLTKNFSDTTRRFLPGKLHIQVQPTHSFYVAFNFWQLVPILHNVFALYLIWFFLHFCRPILAFFVCQKYFPNYSFIANSFWTSTSEFIYENL